LFSRWHRWGENERLGASRVEVSSLSVLCPTRDDGERVAALLGQLRPIADEIVVLANVEASVEGLARYATVADRLIRYEFAMPGERLSAWAHAQCRGDWILVVHGDEVASPGLLERIPEVIARGDLLQAYIPRRWLAPDASGWLDESPWAPDFSLRLVRNDPAVLWFSGETHTTAAAARPAVFLDKPLYHLDCCIKPLAERSLKAAEYEADRPSLKAPGGGPANMFYLPERYATRAPVPLSDEDSAAVLAVLDPVAIAAPPIALEMIPCARRDEIDGLWDRRPVCPSSRSGSIEVVDGDLRFAPGEVRFITVRVANTGDIVWPGGMERQPMIRLGYRGGSGEGPRSPLPCSLAPGESLLVPLAVAAPSEQGKFPIIVDLIHEGVAWFGIDLPVDIDVAEFQIAPD